METEIINILITGAFAVGSLFFIIWLVHLALNNAGVVDVGWGLGFIILCAIYMVMGEGATMRNVILCIMILLWGLRIVLFLFKRLSSDKEEDRRYQKIRREWGGMISLKFFFFFQFQAVLEIILAVPFLIVVLNAESGISFWEILGVIVFGIGLIGETVSDEQLYGFKQSPENKGKLCDIGFWRYSRHPNYFFEWVIWMGIFIYALGSPWGWVSLISPALMFYLMMYVSGVPLAEEMALQSKGEQYRHYQKTTSVFFPMPRKNIEVIL